MEFFDFIFGLAVYLVPTIVALFRRDKVNVGQVAVVNILTGWIFGIGWVIALVMALRDPSKNQPQPIQVNVNQQVGQGHTNLNPQTDEAYQAWLATQATPAPKPGFADTINAGTDRLDAARDAREGVYDPETQPFSQGEK